MVAIIKFADEERRRKFADLVEKDLASQRENNVEGNLWFAALAAAEQMGIGNESGEFRELWNWIKGD